jgi:hypothetical protein
VRDGAVERLWRPVRPALRARRLPPDAHIFTRSKLPWVDLPSDTPAFEVYYDARQLWPAAAQQRWRAALAASA